MWSCSEDGDDKQHLKATSCDQWTIVDEGLFENAPDDPVAINSVVLEGECVNITFSASGCSGEAWEVELIDSCRIAESNPPQRFLRLSLNGTEECEAYIAKEISFDISDLRLQNGEKVYLNIRGGESVLLQ